MLNNPQSDLYNIQEIAFLRKDSFRGTLGACNIDRACPWRNIEIIIIFKLYVVFASLEQSQMSEINAHAASCFKLHQAGNEFLLLFHFYFFHLYFLSGKRQRKSCCAFGKQRFLQPLDHRFD